MSGSNRLVVARLLDTGEFVGLIGLKADRVDVSEGAGNLMIPARRTGGSSGTVSVDYATASGSATSGADFTETSAMLTWTDGDTSDKTIDISIATDTQNESQEVFNVTLSNPASGASLATSEVQVKVLDSSDDAPENLSPSGSGSGGAGGSGGGGAVDWLLLLILALARLRANLGRSELSGVALHR